ncbi:MAG: VWA domain-containing protein [Bacteroidota bacterium]
MKTTINLLLICCNIMLTVVCCQQIPKSDHSVTITPPRTAEPPPPPPVIEEIPNDELSFSDQIKEEEEVVSHPPTLRERYETNAENEFQSPLRHPYSTFSIDVDQASYSNVRRFLMDGTQPPANAIRIEEMINYFDYDYSQPKGERPFSINMELAQCPWNGQHQLLHIGLQGREIPKSNLPPNNLVFLLDVSGSMEDHNKLPLLKTAFKLLVKALRPQDRVAIVVYAGASGVVLPSTSGKQKKSILLALDQLQSGGATGGASGIQLAYKVARQNFLKGGNNRVILATDGDFNVGPSSDEELVRLIEQKRDQGISLSVLGFGTGNYQDAKMEKLADNGNGNYAYIDNVTEAHKVLVKAFSSTLFTIAKDVKLQIEFNPNRVKGYRLIGYENRRLADEDFNNDQKDAGELGAGHSVTALYEIIPTGSSENLSTTIDPLKYQKKRMGLTNTNEWMTLKLRYKAPNAQKSQKIEQALTTEVSSWQSSSENFRFSAAVASFGMNLRHSKYKGQMTYPQILEMARSARGKDEMGYRSEFLKLVELAEAYGTEY